jgi:membrane-associated protein
MHLVQTIVDWSLSAIGVHGYLIVFFATLLENVFLLGSVMPGDILTAGAAFAATTPQGAHLSIWALLGVATLGSMVGMNISYFIGVRGGREFITRISPRFRISIEDIEAAEEFFERNGALTIVLARFVAVLKNMSPAIAGASKMRLWVFEFFALLASAGYAGILLAVGWFLGANFRAGLQYFGAFSWVAFLAVVALVAFAWRSKLRHDAKLIAERAAEFEAEHGRLEPEDSADDDA